MRLTQRRHDNSTNSMWWDWPIVRRNRVVGELSRRRVVWLNADEIVKELEAKR